MSQMKIFRRAVLMIFVVAIMLFAAVTHAEIYTGEGTYIMSEGENLGVAKERAKADAMRNAAEKAGTYVKSYTRTKNLMLEEDVIETMTANILKLIGNPNFSPLKEVDNLEGVLIRVIIQVQIDDSDINRWLNKDEQQKSELVEQNAALRKANEEQARQIAELKCQLSNNPQDKERITQEFADADKVFLSNQKVEEGWKLWDKKDFNGAKNLFDKAINLNPDNAEAWRGSGTALDDLEQYDQAIKYHNKAIELNPKNSKAYNNRGVSYKNLKQYEQAIQDYDKAIELNPKYALAYRNRGFAYHSLNYYEKAIQDFNKAIELNPKYVEAYNERGNAYSDGLKQYKRAIKDFNKAMELNPEYYYAYYNRGLAYRRLGQNERAIQDYDKAIELNPKYALAYNNRGWTYYCMKKYQQALKDFDKALELNPNNTKAKNNRETCLKAMGK